VQIRLFACIAGGLIGAVAASPVSASFGVSPMVAWIGCIAAGLGVGYVASILFDVFTASPGDKNAES
jgi:hypothetical protein